MSTDANKLERVQRKLASLCFKLFYRLVDHKYPYELQILKLDTLKVSRQHVDDLFYSCLFTI